LNYFHYTNPFRIMCVKIYNSNYWKFLIAVFTILSIVGFAFTNFEPRLDQDAPNYD
jgi:hypothetical protein